MKNFSWNYFCNTGQIDAYLLYKECNEELDLPEDNVEVKKSGEDNLLQ